MGGQARGHPFSETSCGVPCSTNVYHAQEVSLALLTGLISVTADLLGPGGVHEA